MIASAIFIASAGKSKTGLLLLCPEELEALIVSCGYIRIHWLFFEYLGGLHVLLLFLAKKVSGVTPKYMYMYVRKTLTERSTI